MRTGVVVSTLGHAGLIVFAIVGIGMTRPLDAMPVESIAVDLISIEEFSNIRKGTLDSTVVETETPSIVEDDTPAEVAQPTGNTEEDQPTPEDTEVVTPAPTQETAPEPMPAPEPEPVEVAEPEPEPQVQPEPAPEPEPVEEPEPVAPAPELAAPAEPEEPREVAPVPVVRTASLDAKRAAFKKQQEEDRKKREEEAREREAEEERIREAKRQEDEAARLADEVANIINSEESRGATTGEGGVATLGKETGQAARLSQSEMARLQAHVKSCMNMPFGSAEDGASALVSFRLSRDFVVMGQPEVIEITGPTMGRAYADAAVRAVVRCQLENGGYAFLPDEKYEGDKGWNWVKVQFNSWEQ
jgi:hypothetical protein